MKKPLLFIFTVLSTGLYAQEHFSGISTSRRVGMLNATLNPAELVNMKTDYEINLINFSVNVANNKATFGELTGGGDEDFEDIIFEEGDPLNMRADVEILGPSFAFKLDKWGFGISSAAKIRANIVDVDVALGRALTGDEADEVAIATSIIEAGYNQKVSATSWGEIGLSAAREIYESEEHKLSAGVTLKLLFPGSYVNMGAGNFSGRVTTEIDGDARLDDARANLNFAYSGSLGEDFGDSGNYSKFFAGGLNGFATDIGINYRWKDVADSTGVGYRLNAGLAVRNLGSMKFKDDNNESTDYELLVPDFDGQDGLDLTQFEDVENIEEIEDILLESGYVSIDQSNKDFKVKLPAVFSAYADVRLLSRLYFTGFVQQKINEDGDNNQIATQNIVTFIPRYSSRGFEAYVPLSHSEIAGFTAGFGFRVGGFFLGSGSILSAALGETNQADLYLGMRIGF